MGNGYKRAGGSDLFSQLADQRVEANRQLEELQSASGTQVSSLVAQVKAKLAELDATVAALVTAELAIQLANYYTKGQTDSKVASPGAIGPSQINMGGEFYSPTARANPVVTSYVAAYLNSDGRLGATPSSRRFKQQITQWSMDWQALFAVELFAYKYNAAVEELGKAAPQEIGLMAEDLDALGLTWLVVYDEEGLPWAVAYERLSLLLLPAVQDHEKRLSALEKLVAVGDTIRTR